MNDEDFFQMIEAPKKKAKVFMDSSIHIGESIGQCEWCGCEVIPKGKKHNGGRVYGTYELYKKHKFKDPFIICEKCFLRIFRKPLIYRKL